MDAELREYLQAMEARMDAKLDSKLGTLEVRIDSKLDALEVRMDAKLGGLEVRMREHTESIETKLLSEFWKWGRLTDMKGRQQSNTVNSLEDRLFNVEERVRDLEFRRPA